MEEASAPFAFNDKIGDAMKDGKFLCFACGRRLDGLFSNHHAPGCPVALKGKIK